MEFSAHPPIKNITPDSKGGYGDWGIIIGIVFICILLDLLDIYLRKNNYF